MSRQTYSECINMGVKDATINGQVGGKYTPATATSQAFFATTLAVVNPKYKDKTGKLQEVKETIYVTIFNTEKGTQWADIFAKYLPVGKRLKNVIVERKQYMAQAKGPSGELLTKADGTPFMIQKESYTLVRAELGRDSTKQVEDEIARWMNGNGELNFTSRPPFWNGAPAHLIAMGRVTMEEANQGKAIWEQITAARAATVYQPGMTMFGCAKVVVKGQPIGQQVHVQPFKPGGIPGFQPAGAVAPTTMAQFAGATLPEVAVPSEEEAAVM